MIGKMPLFAELYGFIIYEPILLNEYLVKNNLKNKNVLSYFTETNHGNIVAENGIAIPMSDIEGDYYNFSVAENRGDLVLKDETKTINSKGWILNISSGKMCIIGMGYFFDIDSINEDNHLQFDMENGWYELEINGGRLRDELYYELILNKKEYKPQFYGNMNYSYKLD